MLIEEKCQGKKLPLEVLKEMEANAKRAGCKRVGEKFKLM
jgi:hypothetical protein